MNKAFCLIIVNIFFCSIGSSNSDPQCHDLFMPSALTEAHGIYPHFYEDVVNKNVVDLSGPLVVYSNVSEVDGLKIKSSAFVRPEAFTEVNRIISQMTIARPAMLKEVQEEGFEIIVLGQNENLRQLPEFVDAKTLTRGVTTGDAQKRITVVPEENVLNLPKQGWPGTSVVVHEFAHAFHLNAIRVYWPQLAKRVTDAYANAMAKSLWKNTYGATNEFEYFAKGTQAWFNAVRPGPPGGNGTSNEIATRMLIRNYDPELASILEFVWRDSSWRYSEPNNLAQ